MALVYAAFTAPALACAQSTLSLDEATAAALSGNRSLQAARSSVGEAQSGVREAQSAFYPRITIAESWQRGDQPVFVFSSLLSSRRFAASNFAIDALNHPDPIGFFRTSVGVEQVIVDGGRQRSAASAAALRRDLAAHQTDEAAMDLMVAVATTYGRVLAAQAARRGADAGVESAREDLTRTERRRDAGMATEAEVLGLRVHMADLQQRSIQADGDAAVARAELNRMMAAPIDRDYVVADPRARANESLDRNALVAAALEARPSIKASDAAARLATTTQRASRAALIPQLSAQAGIDMSGTTFNDRSSSWLIGGELRWSFSTGGAELARMKAAADAASRARLDVDDARAAVEVEVVSAIRRLEAARARQLVGTAAVDQARESQRIIRDRFDAGIAGTDDVLRASTALLDAEAQRASALVDGLVAQAMLDRAIGRTAAGKGTP
jgi:outer membrane protein TolC